MKRYPTILLLVLSISCAPIYVNYDYETGTDFSQYKTYSVFPELNTGLSEFDDKRLLDAMDDHLRGKGFSISENPDFYINISSKQYEYDRRSTVGVGVGGTGRNVGGGISVGIPVGSSTVNRELIFDFIDVKNNALFWQAVSESTFDANSTPEEREEQLKDLVTKVFYEYPPEN